MCEPAFRLIAEIGVSNGAGAEVAKRQTQWTQNPPWVTTWGFKSPPRHQNNPRQYWRFSAGDFGSATARGQRPYTFDPACSDVNAHAILQRIYFRFDHSDS